MSAPEPKTSVCANVRARGCAVYLERSRGLKPRGSDALGKQVLRPYNVA